MNTPERVVTDYLDELRQRGASTRPITVDFDDETRSVDQIVTDYANQLDDAV